MEKEAIIKRLRDSNNLPCIIVNKTGEHFLGSPQEIKNDSIRYGVYDETALGFLKSNDYLIGEINSKDIMLEDIISVISWPELKEYRQWIDTWEKH